MDSKRVKLQDLGTTPGPEVKEVNFSSISETPGPTSPNLKNLRQPYDDVPPPATSLDKAQIESGLLAKRRQTQRTNMPVITRIVSRRGATLFRRNFHSGEVSALCCENEI